MRREPSTNGGRNGRNKLGQFTAGNAGGPGNPFGGSVGRLRSALYQELSPTSLRKVVRKLIRQAQAGDVKAAGELLRVAVGRPARHLDRLNEITQRGNVTEALVEAVVDRLVANLQDDFAPEARGILRDWLRAGAFGDDGDVRRR